VTYGNIATLMKADSAHRLAPSGSYVRVKDRPENQGQQAARVESEDPPF
jgi:hypothetical protein